MNRTQRVGIILVRVVIALMLMIHGINRISLGLVDELGVFLGKHGVWFSDVVAWLISIGEIAGGAALALGFFVVWLSGWFALELAVGIALVHYQEGWFVVGSGRNGMEYSIVLITALAAIVLLHHPAESMRQLRLIGRAPKPAPDSGQNSG